MRGVKRKDYENLSDSNIKKVIGLLEASPAISKKDACEILNISYNTTRLTKIIEEFKTQQENIKRLKAKKRGKPATDGEIRAIVEEYMEGSPITDIAKRNYRSIAFTKAVIDRVGVPERLSGEEKLHTQYLPDECVGETFEVNEVAWSATYHASCTIVRKLEEPLYMERYGCECYNVYINEDTQEGIKGGFYASAPAYDLGKLTHLEKYGIVLSNL